MPKTPKTEPEKGSGDVPPAPIELVEIPFRGATFTIPKDRDDWDAEAFLAIAHGQHIASLQMILGPDQWLKLRQIGTSRRITKEFSAIFGEVAERECIN